MIDIRIVCTHDAVKLAETLTRLLEAEQHRVRLTFGRQALSELEEARTAHEAVVLIWSPDARSQTYMHEWGRKIEAARLVELARTPDVPRIDRKAPVIEFSQWRGERGGRAWDALNERLRAVRRVLNPPKPAPKRAVAALGLASVIAMAGAITERINDHRTDATADPARDEIASVDASAGIGGPLSAFEPASFNEDTIVATVAPDILMIDGSENARLTDVHGVPVMSLRDETLLERLTALNPLRQQRTPEQE